MIIEWKELQVSVFLRRCLSSLMGALAGMLALLMAMACSGSLGLGRHKPTDLHGLSIVDRFLKACRSAIGVTTSLTALLATIVLTALALALNISTYRLRGRTPSAVGPSRLLMRLLLIASVVMSSLQRTLTLLRGLPGGRAELVGMTKAVNAGNGPRSALTA
jgi:hypothetical protein